MVYLNLGLLHFFDFKTESKKILISPEKLLHPSVLYISLLFVLTSLKSNYKVIIKLPIQLQTYHLKILKIITNISV